MKNGKLATWLFDNVQITLTITTIFAISILAFIQSILGDGNIFNYNKSPFLIFVVLLIMIIMMCCPVITDFNSYNTVLISKNDGSHIEYFLPKNKIYFRFDPRIKGRFVYKVDYSITKRIKFANQYGEITAYIVFNIYPGVHSLNDAINLGKMFFEKEILAFINNAIYEMNHYRIKTNMFDNLFNPLDQEQQKTFVKLVTNYIEENMFNSCVCSIDQAKTLFILTIE